MQTWAAVVCGVAIASAVGAGIYVVTRKEDPQPLTSENKKLPWVAQFGLDTAAKVGVRPESLQGGVPGMGIVAFVAVMGVVVNVAVIGGIGYGIYWIVKRVTAKNN